MDQVHNTSQYIQNNTTPTQISWFRKIMQDDTQSPVRRRSHSNYNDCHIMRTHQPQIRTEQIDNLSLSLPQLPPADADAEADWIPLN